MMDTTDRYGPARDGASPLVRLDGLAKRIGHGSHHIRRSGRGIERRQGKTASGQSYPDSGDGMALRDATCVIGQGEFVAIIGPSGSGKTTLLSILGLLDRPSQGRYRLAGTDVSALPEKELNRFRGMKFGFVFQNSYLVGAETARENVSLGLRVRGVPRRTRRALTERALARVGLSEQSSKRSASLSGGEKQRVAVARALVTAPDVILADEPTGALDTASTERLVELLREINQQGTTVIVVTHDPVVAAAASRCLRLEDGVLLAADTVVLPHLRVGGEPKLAGQEALAPAGTPAGTPAGKSTVRLGQEMSDAIMAPFSRPVRSLLVGLAYTLGIASLVAAIGVTASTTGQIVNRLTDAASKEIVVADNSDQRPDTAFEAALGNEIGSSSTLEKTAAIADLWNESSEKANRIAQLEGVAAAVPVRSFTIGGNTVTRIATGSAAATGDSQSGFGGHLVVTDSRYFDAYGVGATSGNTALLDNSWNGLVVAMGSGAAQRLGIAEADPGVVIWVNRRPVDVAAVLAPSGDAIRDDTLYFSAPAMAILADQLDSQVIVHAEAGYSEPLAKAIPYVLAPDNPGRIGVSTVAQLAKLQQGIGTDLSRLLGMIGSVILALSALTAGIAMFLSVQQREPEIALRRAMGASRSSVWRIFTYEGTAVGLGGGIAGTFLGVSLAAAVSQANNWPICLGFTVIVTGVGVGTVTGMAASVIPAIHAARRDPAQLLRAA
jgi:macrolide transport system ATP-binding/permease protein